MNSKYVESKLDYIELLFNYFKAKELDDELTSHIAKYMTVLISGVFEESIKSILKESIQKETITNVTRSFIFKQIEITFRNPDHKNIKTLLNKFNKEWIKNLNNIIEDKNWESLNSIVNNKNNIAHGNSSSITFEDIKTYYNDSRIIIIELDQMILNE
jgi:hypothetical protein